MKTEPSMTELAKEILSELKDAVSLLRDIRARADAIESLMIDQLIDDDDDDDDDDG